MNIQIVDGELEVFGVRVSLVVLFMGLFGVVMIMVGMGSMSYDSGSAVEVIESGERSMDEQVVGDVVVDVSGAVERPGVYRLPEGGRVGEALEAAGGLTDEADEDFMARRLNLAAKLVDGTKVYIPFVGELESGSLPADLVDTNAGVTSGSVQGSGVVNVNTASEGELDSLWGIGKSRAADIAANRPYTDVGELKSKADLPDNVIEKNEGKISF